MLEDNLIYLCFIAMLLITVINILLLELDFMQPSVLFNSTMTTSMFFAVLNVDKYGLFVGEYTFFVVLLGMISFAFGNYYVYSSSVKVLQHSDARNVVVKYKYIKIVITSIVMLVLLYFSFKEVYDLSIALGNTTGISNMIKTVRYPLEREEISFSRWNSYRGLVSQVIAYVSLYYFFESVFYKKIREYFYLLPVILYIPFTILSTGRLSILCFLIYALVLFSVFYLKQKEYAVGAKIKIVSYLAGTAIVFVVLFLSYGYFTGKVAGATRTPFVILSHYAGLSIPALDVYLRMPVLEDSLIGSNTLSGIYSNLRTLGFDIPKVDIFLPFVKFNTLTTNVYTAFRRYVSDYGVLGMCCILFIFGSLFSLVYEKIKYGNNKMLLILYASYAWTLIMSFHDEKFLMGIVNTSLVYRVVILYLVVKFFEYGASVEDSNIDNR